MPSSMSPDEWSARTIGDREAAEVGGAAGVHRVELLAGPSRRATCRDRSWWSPSLRSAWRCRAVSPTWSPWPCVSTMCFTPFDRRRLVGDEGRIAGEERIDQHRVAAEIEPESRMAVPGDLHGRLLVGRACREAQRAMVGPRRRRLGFESARVHRPSARHAGPDAALPLRRLAPPRCPAARRADRASISAPRPSASPCPIGPAHRVAAGRRSGRTKFTADAERCSRSRRSRRRGRLCSACRSTWTARRSARAIDARLRAQPRALTALPIALWDERLSTAAVTAR